MEDSRNAQYWITAAASLTSFTSSMSITWVTPVLPMLHNNETDIYLTEDEASWLVLATGPGMTAGSMCAQYPLNKIGRRGTLMLTALPFIVGTMFILAATKAWMLCLGRFIWGLSTGMIQLVIMIYITEIASKDIRGKLGIGNRLFLNLGAFLVLAIGSLISFQALSSLIIVFPICYFIVFCFLPETPYFLLKEGKVEAAGKVLQRLNGYSDEKVLQDKLTEMQENVKHEMKRSGGLKELLTGKQYRKAIIAVFGLYTTRLLSGSIPLKQYVGRILQETKSDISVSGGLMVFGAVTFTTSMFASFLVDKVGRRPLLIISFLGTAITLAVLGGCFFLSEVMGIIPPYFGYINLLCNLLVCVLGTLGYDTVGFIIPAELFPLNVKAAAMTYMSLYSDLIIILTIRGYQVIKDFSGLYGVFWVFGFFAIVGAVFSYLAIPETKGKSLKEIQQELQGKYYNESNLNIAKETELKEVKYGANQGEELQPLKSKPTDLVSKTED